MIRYLYFWRYEITTRPHEDWERVELWIDAETGKVKWVVSDYHWRELWYRVEDGVDDIFVNIIMNFHTPIPIVSKAHCDSINKTFAKPSRTLTKALFTGKSSELVKEMQAYFKEQSAAWKARHPPEFIEKYGLPGMTAKFASGLPWDFWRYVKGLEEPEIYRNEPASPKEDQPKGKLVAKKKASRRSRIRAKFSRRKKR